MTDEVRDARGRDELAARRSDPPYGAARSTRDASSVAAVERDASPAAGVERRIVAAVGMIRWGALLLVLPAFGVGAKLLVGPGSDILGLLCIAAGFACAFIAIDDELVG